MFIRRVTTGRFLVAATIACGLLACAPPEGAVDPVAAESAFALTLGGGSLGLAVGETAQLQAIPVDSTGKPFQGLFTLTWASSNPQVVDVSGSGLLTGRMGGTGTVTATATRLDTGAKASAAVSVTVASGSSSGTGGPPPPPPPTTRATLSPATALDIVNPERGFYGWAGADLVSAFDSGSVQSSYAEGRTLVLAQVDLGAYRNSDLPSSWLSALGARFAAIRSAGVKATLLFAYDFSAGGNDATATQIVRHLQQLKPVLAANADVIPYMRAGFIGAWGEWHSSKAGNSCGYNSGTTSCATADANRAIVRDALLANVPPTTQIQFRYPADLMTWYPTPGQQGRVGMHDDCFLAGPSDSGTYQSQAQRDYAMAFTSTSAFGGETCEGETPLRTSCAAILTEGPQYHLAWLNVTFDTTFIDQWKADGCFDKVAGFMGYRLQLDAVTAPVTAQRGTSATVGVELRNVGWARLFSDRKLQVILRNGATTIVARSGADLRALGSQATASTTAQVTMPIPTDAPAGDYELFVALPDAAASLASDARFSVRFANADDAAKKQAWDGAAARFDTGVVIKVQ